jgi:hypothetical protein
MGSLESTMSRLLALLLVALGLAACHRVGADVTTFHNCSEPPKGKSFTMLPYRSQAGSLEWRSYASLVAFEGIGSGASPTAALTPVMPTIVAGIFTDRPGPSGQTRRT